ncbi:MAG: glycosyltransferase family 4 protein [Steroidobacteraceae bacterium]
MKILMLAPQPFFCPRGTPMSVYYRAVTMAELGANIDLVTYGYGDDVDLPGIRHLRVPKLPFVKNVPVGPSVRKLLNDVLMVLYTLRLCLATRYDAVHAHEEAVFWAALLKPLFGYKLIYDMHSSLPQQLDNFRRRRFRWFKPVFSWLEKQSIKTADFVVTICPALEQQVSGLANRGAFQIRIENSLFGPIGKAAGVDVCESSIYSERIVADRRWIYYGGTFEAYQGVEMLVDAMPSVLRACPEAGLLLAGGTEAQIRNIARRVSALGISEAVALVGTVQMSVAKQFMDMCSVVVSPRMYGTNTPMKIYEQLASGKPLVSTRILSHTQVLNDEVCFLVDPDEASLANGLISALVNSDQVRSKVEAAKQFYDRQYSKQAYTDRVRQVIARVS